MRRKTLLGTLLILAGLWAPKAQAVVQGPFKFYPVYPCRLLDTRLNPGVPLTSGPEYFYQVVGRCGVPVAAKAVSLNVVSVSPTAQGFVAVYPTNAGGYQGISTLNVNAGERALANGAIVPLGTDATSQLIATYGTAAGGTSHLVLEILGYFR